jgi:hypothetical protein
LVQAFFAPMPFGRIDNRVQLEVVHRRQITNRLKSKAADFDRRTVDAAETGNAAADISNHGCVHGNHQEDQAGAPVSTNKTH